MFGPHISSKVCQGPPGLLRFERLLCIEIHFGEPSLGDNCSAWMLWKLFCLSVCLIGESRVSNKMPSTQSHAYSQSFNSCPMLFSLGLLKTMPACPLVLLLGTWLALTALGKCFYAVLSRGEHPAGVT